jgi:hypothetical protein
MALVGDAAENIATLALLATSPNPSIPGLKWVLGVAMSLAALAKWVGLAGCSLRVAWGLRGPTLKSLLFHIQIRLCGNKIGGY